MSLHKRKNGVQNGGGLTAEPQPLQAAPRECAPEREAQDAREDTALVAGQKRAVATPEAIARSLAELEHAATFLKSRYIEGVIVEAVYGAVTRANSPWLDRAGAAAYCCCSTSEIDRAAKLNLFKTHRRAGTPLFHKSDLDLAIASGRWPKRR